MKERENKKGIAGASAGLLIGAALAGGLTYTLTPPRFVTSERVIYEMPQNKKDYIEQLEKINENNNNNARAFKKVMESKNEEIKILEDNNFNLREDKEALTDRIFKLQEEMGTLRVLIGYLSNNLKHYKGLYEQHKSNNIDLSTQLNERTEKVKELSHNIHQLQNLIDEITTVMERTERDRKAQGITSIKAIAEVSKSWHLLEGLKGFKSSFIELQDAYAKESDRGQKERTTYINQLAEKGKEIASIKEDKEYAENGIDQLENKLDYFIINVPKLEERAKASSEELADIKNKVGTVFRCSGDIGNRRNTGPETTKVVEWSDCLSGLE